MIKISNLTKVYKDNKKRFVAIDHISLDVPRNKVVGLIGPNGAGKTTLVKIVSNLITKTSGRIMIDGVDTEDHPVIARNMIGIVLEGARNLYNFLSVEANLRYFSYLNDIPQNIIKQKIDHFLQEFSLGEKKHSSVNSLSRGMQQKVAIILSLIKDPEILILDEPTLGLDIESTLAIKRYIKELASKHNKTIIITSHMLDLVEDLCEEVIIMNKGRVVANEKVSSIYNHLNAADRYEILLLQNDFTRSKQFLSLLEMHDAKVMNESPDVITVEVSSYQKLLSDIKDSVDIYRIKKVSHSLEQYFLDIIKETK